MSSEMTKKEKIDDILSRGVGDFIDPDGVFRKKLENNPEKVVIKFGVDPTRPDIHLGHAVVFRKLRQFQDLGCKVIFLVGDYTAQIGDPTGKNNVRPEIQFSEIIENMKTYLAQIDKILNLDKSVFSWIRNSDWFTDVSDIGLGLNPAENINIEINGIKKIYQNDFVGKAELLRDSRMQLTHLNNQIIHTISLSRVLGTLRGITHARLISRDMFQDRLKNNKELYMHEMLYPVLQGLDSSAIYNIYGACDIEVGGTDQTFNMLLGRDVMKMYKQKEQAVLAFKLLEGTDGKEKMSKSLDNYIGITDEPNDMYGKTMSIPDASIGNYFELCTFTSLSEVEKIRKSIIDGSVNPKDLKMKLAHQIVSTYHGEKKAEEAEKNWESTFSKKEIPEDVEVFTAKENDLLVDIFLRNKIVSSKSDFRRLIEEGAITNLGTDEKINATGEKVKGGTYRIGKKRFCKIEIE